MGVQNTNKRVGDVFAKPDRVRSILVVSNRPADPKMLYVGLRPRFGLAFYGQGLIRDS
jgi:hypothetical protein